MAIEWENGIPILNGESYLSEVPQYTQELASVVAGVTPIGSVIPYAGDWGTDYANLADPDVGTPFHLPCTGGVYESDDFPLLSRVLTRDGIDPVTGRPYPEGHLFVDGMYGAPTHGMIESGQDINGHAGHSYPFWNESGGSLTGDATAWRPDTSLWMFHDGVTAGSKPTGWHRITMKGFAVPDFRGRSPVGHLPEHLYSMDNGYVDGPVTKNFLGQRFGDWRMQAHWHWLSSVGDNLAANYGGIAESGQDRWYKRRTEYEHYGSPQSNAHTSSDQSGPRGGAENQAPATVVNFLVFTGQVVPPGGHKPKSTGLRDGSVHRLHPMTTEHMIRQRLADPDISEYERGMLTAQLNGEPWPLSGESMAEPTFKSTTPPQGKLP